MTPLAQEYASRLGQWSDIQDHMPVLFDTAKSYPEAIVLELGTRSGNSTAAFLAAVEMVDGHLWSVDIAYPNVPDWWAVDAPWTYFVEDDMAIDLALLPGKVDVLFIDTSHDYDHTLAELGRFVPLVKAGGVVLMHDTDLETMPELAPQDPYPVRRAIETYCAAVCGWRRNRRRPGRSASRSPRCV